MKTNYLAMCFAAAVFLLIGCNEKPESEMGEKAASPAVPAVVEPTPGAGPGAVPATTEGPGETMNEPGPDGEVMEDAPSDEPGGMDSSEENQDNADPMLTPAPSPTPEPVE